MTTVRSILALGAHPDDLELGCGATLAKLCAEGAAVHAVILSRGTNGAAEGADRTAETREALETLGVASVTQHEFPDTRLHENLNELIGAIEGHVRARRPARVYTMFHLDRHQDHRAVHEASIVACRPVPQILGYETPSSYPNFIPTVFEPVEEHIEAKVRATALNSAGNTDVPMKGKFTQLEVQRLFGLGGDVSLSLAARRNWNDTGNSKYRGTGVRVGLVFGR